MTPIRRTTTPPATPPPIAAASDLDLEAEEVVDEMEGVEEVEEDVDDAEVSGAP
jgi:hypothetical protein